MQLLERFQTTDLLLMGLRGALRARRFSWLAILPLSLGVTSVVIALSVAERIYYHSLPVAAPEKLMVLRSPGSNLGSVDIDTRETAFSYPLYRDLAAEAGGAFEIAARGGDMVSLEMQGGVILGRVEFVSGNYFPLLGLSPAAGRLLGPGDDRDEAGAVEAVLSYSRAVTQFSNPAAAVGQTVRVNGSAFRIAGVAPESFIGIAVGRSPEVYLPLRAKRVLRPSWMGFHSRRSAWLNLFGRCREGISPVQAEARINGLYRNLLKNEEVEIATQGAKAREEFLSRRLSLIPAARGIDTVQVEWAEPIRVLVAAAALLFAIAWVNFMHLVSVRLLRRGREFAIQLSLGASRHQIMIPIVSEILALVLVGIGLGLLLALAVQRMLRGYLPQELTSGWLPITPDWRVLAVVFAASLAAGLLTAAAGGAAVVRGDHNLLHSASNLGASRIYSRLAQVMLCLQGTASVFLLILAVLFNKSVQNLVGQRMGIEPERVITLSLAPGLARYDGPASFAYYQQALTRIRELPGVSAAGVTSNPLFSGLNSFANVTVEGYDAAENRFVLSVRSKVSPGFFKTLGIGLVSGRDFDDADAANGGVAIVNQEFVRIFMNGQMAEGRRVAIGSGRTVTPDLRVVGVVGDFRQKKLREPPRPTLFVPLAAASSSEIANVYARLEPKSGLTPSRLAAFVRDLAPNVPVHSADWLNRLVEVSANTDRLLLNVAATFAAIAWLLALTGVIGLVQYETQSRQTELAIRMALGADRRRIVWLVAKRMLYLALGSAAMGAAVAALASKLVQSLLFGVQPLDAAAYSAAIACYVAASIVAVIVPAFTGSDIQPAMRLRIE
jgi:predicted permease